MSAAPAPREPSVAATPDPLGEYLRVRARTEALCAPLTPEDMVVQSMPDASPAKWHLAHTTWFFETFLLSRAERPHVPHDGRWGFLWNSYYDAVGPRHPRPRRGLLTRPSVEEVRAYRRRVDERVERVVRRGLDPEALEIMTLGLHHEQQHQELLLTDVKHAFSCNPLWPAYAPPLPADGAAAPALRWVAIAGGLQEIGHAGAGFAFDNEGPRHRVWIEPFSIASRLVTNGEYLAFVEDGGYRRPELWLSDGFAAAQEGRWGAPLYWSRDEATGWTEFTLHGPRSLAPDEPVVHVSFYEADAYARWAGARLATEQEWEVVAAGEAVEGRFADAGRFHPAPAPARRPAQLFGDAWEWTRSAYEPYPRFRPAAGALGEYNGKFMSNQMVLRGGSCATPAGHVRATYRNFFPPGARWQLSGIRLAREE